MSAPKLHELFAQLRPYMLRERDFASTLGTLPGVTNEGHFATYRRFIQLHEQDVLGQLFSTCRRVLPEADWSALEAGWFRAHPLHARAFHDNVAAFPEFVAARHAEGDPTVPAWLVELAALEWLETALRYDATVIPEDGPLQLNPVLALSPLGFDLLPLLLDEEAMGPPAPLEPGRFALAFRVPENDRIRQREAEARDLFVLKVLSEGLPLDEACEAGGIPRATLDGWLEALRDEGLLIGG